MGNVLRVIQNPFGLRFRVMPYTHGAYRTLVVRTLHRLSCISRHRSPVGINRCDTAPTPTGFAEIVSDDFPVLH